MTGLLVARIDGVIKGTDGALYRVVRGKTLADPKHPAPQRAPQAFVPMHVELSVESSDPGHLEDAASEGEAELKAQCDALEGTLNTIADALETRGLLPAELDRSKPGWLTAAVIRALDTATGKPGERPVVPPRKAAAAKTVPRKVSADGA